MATTSSATRCTGKPSRRCTGDDGASLVEYALLLALIVVACIGAVTFLGTSLDDSLSTSTSELFGP
jgi:Flp pilus assembly pilin Flp